MSRGLEVRCVNVSYFIKRDMKQLLTAFFVTLLSIAFCYSAQAQGLPGDKLDIVSSNAVAFVKADRSILYIKRPGASVDSYDLVSLITSATQGSFQIDSIRHLAVIGMTPNQDHIVLGGALYFVNPLNQQHVSFIGIFRLPWPLTLATITADPPVNTQTLAMPWFLVPAPNGAGGFHPVGVLSPDGSEWWATPQSSSEGNERLVFYHGKVVGGTSVDSAVVTTEIAGNGRPPQGGWITSNVTLDTSSHTMLVFSFDGMNDPSQSGRFMITRWNPQNVTPLFSCLDITGQVKGLATDMYFIDSLFGLTLIPHQDGGNVDLAIANVSKPRDGSIQFYSARYNSIGALTSSSNLLSRHVIPDANATFFAGGKAGSYQDANSQFHNNGQSGDIMVTRDGRYALFTTHGYPFDSTATYPHSQRNVKSAIYSYDFNGSGQAQLIYNDSNAQEIQPVFVPSLDTIPHTPSFNASTSSLTFAATDTGKTASSSVTITDASSFAGGILDSAVISGANASEFSIVGEFPVTVQHSSSATINLKFAPVGAAGSRSATLKIYSHMANQTLSISLSGTAKVQQGGGGSVAEDPVLAANMTVQPNPFTARTSIALVAPQDGAIGIVVHDALGRTVYTSDVRKVGAGATENFSFDAQSLALPNGVYYVTAFIGERSASRQVIFVR